MKKKSLRKGTATSKISRIFGIHLSTLGYWSKAKDFRNKILNILKTFSEKDLETMQNESDIIKNGRSVYFNKDNSTTKNYKIGDILLNDDPILNLIINDNEPFYTPIINILNNPNEYKNIKLPKKYDESFNIVIREFSFIICKGNI